MQKKEIKKPKTNKKRKAENQRKTKMREKENKTSKVCHFCFS